jgi:16S rRNA (cytosine967-C5)-methyltransferase
LRLHKGLIEATVDALQDIFIRERQADKVVEMMLKSNKKWGSRDRAFLASNTYEMVRWWRLVLFCDGLEETPEADRFWRLVGTWLIIKPIHLGLDTDNDLPEWEEFMYIRKANVLARYEEGMQIRKIAQSIPDWMDEAGERELGVDWDAEIQALNQEAAFVLRVNRLKTDVASVQRIFGEAETELVPGIPDAIVLKKRQNIAARDSFKMGYFEVQDAGSQCIAPFLDVQPGHIVIDACAGAGGKSLHLAALMKNKGEIIAMDVDNRKLIELENRAKRNGVKIIQTEKIRYSKALDKYAGTIDRLLLDVPCSGLGVLRRNPDSKWKLSEQFVASLKELQWEILTNYSKTVKQGGKMVYATCSILPSESEDQVNRFIETHGDLWKLTDSHRSSPAKDGFDGFYMALLERK